MAVYVGLMRYCERTRSWAWREKCHLFADDVLELHLHAHKMGLKRDWFQDNPRLPHYDLTRRQRRVAIRLGAIEATDEMLIEKMRKVES